MSDQPSGDQPQNDPLQNEESQSSTDAAAEQPAAKPERTRRVRLLVSRVGDRFSQNVGQTIEVGESEARRLIEAGHAEPDPVESMTAGSARRAVRR